MESLIIHGAIESKKLPKVMGVIKSTSPVMFFKFKLFHCSRFDIHSAPDNLNTSLEKD
jgi:hypothetical protein